MSIHPRSALSIHRVTHQRGVIELALDLASTSVADLTPAEVLSWGVGDIGRALGGAAVVLTLDDRDAVRATCWSEDRVEALARAQEHEQAGLGVRALRTGRVCVAHDLADEQGDVQAAHALGLGLGRSAAAPLRINDAVSGSLQLFWPRERALAPDLLDDVEVLARMLGAVAGNAALYGDSVRSAARLSRVLDERAPVEQAKGMLAERHRIEPNEAFVLLRRHARDHRVSLVQASKRVVERGDPFGPPARPGRRRRRQPVN